MKSISSSAGLLLAIVLVSALIAISARADVCDTIAANSDQCPKCCNYNARQLSFTNTGPVCRCSSIFPAIPEGAITNNIKDLQTYFQGLRNIMKLTGR